jgi:hypothetical protein
MMLPYAYGESYWATYISFVYDLLTIGALLGGITALRRTVSDWRLGKEWFRFRGSISDHPLLTRDGNNTDNVAATRD